MLADRPQVLVEKGTDSVSLRNRDETSPVQVLTDQPADIVHCFRLYAASCAAQYQLFLCL